MLSTCPACVKHAVRISSLRSHQGGSELRNGEQSLQRPPFRVVLGDDQAPTRIGVRSTLERDGFHVCAEAEDAAGTVEAVVRERPDLCLLGVRIPGDGIFAIASINRLAPEVTV